MKTLVLYAQYANTFSYFDDWMDAFQKSAFFAATSYNILAHPSQTEAFKKSVNDFDLIVLLHSTNADSPRFLEPFLPALSIRKGPLIVFAGNEYNSPDEGGIRHKIRLFQKMSPEVIATQLPLYAGQKLYEDVRGSRVIEMPHALNPEKFKDFHGENQKKIDIGVVSFHYLPYLGDRERNDLIDYFRSNGQNLGLKTDIRTHQNQRMDRERWALFLNDCKATISTEAGSYYLEKDDATAIKIKQFLLKESGNLPLIYKMGRSSRLKSWIPNFLKKTAKSLSALFSGEDFNIYSASNFEEIHQTFFLNYPNPLSGKCVSSRHFEAIGMKVCQIMFPGTFNGILKADQHYIALKKDFSNIVSVIEKIKDPEFRRAMTERSLEWVLSRHTHAHRLETLRDFLENGSRLSS